MEERKVHYSITNHVAYITIDNDKFGNALDEAIQNELIEYLDGARFNKDVRVIVLQAEGRIFSGGGNVRMLKEVASDPVANASRLDDALAQPGSITRRMREITKPIVVAIQGAVAGAAANIVLAGDFRIVAENASLVEAFIGIGLSTDGGGAYLLTKLVGAAKATEMIMLGYPVKAEEMKQLNLATKIVPLEALREETVKFAERLARGPGKSYRYMKAMINQAAYADILTALATEVDYQNICIRTEDCMEGINSFLEKRKPQFKGC